jgi:hypothetical protein
MKAEISQSSEPRAGWALSSYCAACGFSRATFYNLPLELRPQSVTVGRRRIIIEAPDAYLARLAAMQKSTTRE